MHELQKGQPEGESFAGRSSLYAQWLAERDEILRHKWIESEKAGRVIIAPAGVANAAFSNPPNLTLKIKRPKSVKTSAFFIVG